MNNRHKYFRKKRFQAKLKAKAGHDHTYWSHTMFFTKEPDPRALREQQTHIWRLMQRRHMTEEQAVAYCTSRDHYGNAFIYFDKPQVAYTIKKVHTSPRYSARRKYFQKHANKALRRKTVSQPDVKYQYGQYKKAFEVKWQLD